MSNSIVIGILFGLSQLILYLYHVSYNNYMFWTVLMSIAVVACLVEEELLPRLFPNSYFFYTITYVDTLKKEGTI